MLTSAVGVACLNHNADDEPENLEEPKEPRPSPTPTASLTIVASLDDAEISLDDLHQSRGTLEVSDLEAGSYSLHVERPGFEPVDKTVSVEPGQNGEKTVDLEPRNFDVQFETEPAARLRIDHDEIQLEPSDSPFSTTVPAGELELRVDKDGYAPIERTFFVDRDIDETLYLDPEDQLVEKTGHFDSGGAPKAAEFSPDGDEIWVARLLDETAGVRVLDAETGEQVADINLEGAGGVELIFSAGGNRAYASQMETGSVFEIDTESKEVLRKLDTESAWTKVMATSFDGEVLVASNWSGDDVSVIDLDSGEVDRRIPTVDTPRGLYLTLGGRTLYVAGFGDGELQRINLSTGHRDTIFDRGGSLRHIVANPWRGEMFISDLRYNLIWKMDMDTEKVSLFARTEVSPNTIALSPDGRVLFVSCRGRSNPEKGYHYPGPEWGSVLLYDTDDATMLDAIVGGNQPTGLDVTDDGERLVFSNFLDGELEVYDIPDYEILSSGDGGRSDSYRSDLPK